jgi:pyrroloquinoline quinone biosynthesis protein E
VKPRMARGARVRVDRRDGTPVLLSPERGLRLSRTAAAVVELCDGTRSVDAIVEALVVRYGEAERARILRDVVALLTDLRARGVVDDFGMSRSAQGVEEPVALPDAAPSREGSPYTLVAELTHRCPLACPYCSNPRELVHGRDELTTDEWLRVVQDAASLGVMQVHLSGGEPLARADLEPIAACARASDLYVNLVTSGVPLERERLERLAPSLDHVQLSIQDADASSSDRIADFAAFDQKVRVAGWVRDLGLPLTINVVLHRDNLDRVESIVAMAERLGADRLELANVQLVSWALENRAALLPSRAQIEHARAVSAEAKRRLEGKMQVVFVLPDWHADRPRACMDGWARRFMVVAPDGMVLPCHAARALPLSFESVRSRSLKAIWKDNGALQAFRGEGWMPEPCKSCDRRSIDFGGCRCQAFALTGDARATDPACPLSPRHQIVRTAREEAERAGEKHFVFRGRGASARGAMLPPSTSKPSP